MTEDPVMTFVAARRFGYRFTPETVAALVPFRRCGVYVLLDEHTRLMYVGRSDTCIRSRLEGHELLGVAAYFVWDPHHCAEQAFIHESWWYHQLAQHPAMRNQRHPARPVGTDLPCPFCNPGDTDALRRALAA